MEIKVQARLAAMTEGDKAETGVMARLPHSSYSKLIWAIEWWIRFADPPLSPPKSSKCKIHFYLHPVQASSKGATLSPLGCEEKEKAN